MEIFEDWIAPWVARKLREASKVTRAEALNGTELMVHRINMPTVKIAGIKANQIHSDTVASVLERSSNPNFILNLAPSGWISESGWNLAHQKHIGLGSMSTLTSTIWHPDISKPVDTYAEFVLRSVAQHSNVLSIDQIASTLYMVTLLDLSTIRAAIIYDYDLGADGVRTALGRYSSIDVLVSGNPNARTSAEAHAAATYAGVPLKTSWSHFLGYLRSPR